MGSEPTL